MRTLGKLLYIVSVLGLMFFGSALDSPTIVPVIGCLVSMAGLATTVCIAGCLV